MDKTAASLPPSQEIVGPKASISGRIWRDGKWRVSRAAPAVGTAIIDCKVRYP
jgi:hypothetical protein